MEFGEAFAETLLKFQKTDGSLDAPETVVFEMEDPNVLKIHIHATEEMRRVV